MEWKEFASHKIVTLNQLTENVANLASSLDVSGNRSLTLVVRWAIAGQRNCSVELYLADKLGNTGSPSCEKSIISFHSVK